ncbi:MAG: hypothetical protein OEM46_03585 [Ignavibacteria bacterium]|nr:hypothetical protein [Ignavibacteria bacterium]
MILIITLLIFSASLNIALIFGMVRKNADEDMIKIRTKEGLNVQDSEYFSA